jgi:hypothetical protein
VGGWGGCGVGSGGLLSGWCVGRVCCMCDGVVVLCICLLCVVVVMVVIMFWIWCRFCVEE